MDRTSRRLSDGIDIAVRSSSSSLSTGKERERERKIMAGCISLADAREKIVAETRPRMMAVVSAASRLVDSAAPTA